MESAHANSKPSPEEIFENHESIKNFFARMNALLTDTKSCDQQNIWMDEKKINMFKAICVFDYMHAGCDWDSNASEQTPYWEGKETYALYLMNEILDPENPGFYCKECDDTNTRDACEHVKTDRCDKLNEYMDAIEKDPDWLYEFLYPNKQGEFLIDCTKRLFSDRKMNCGQFLDFIFNEYIYDVDNTC